LSWSQLVPTERPVDTSNRTAVAPSLLSADFARLADEIEAVERAGAEFLHLDVMDGHFVPNLTFGPMVVEAISRDSTVVLDAHLMITSPHRYLEQFVKAGAHIVTIHVEASEDISRDLKTIHDLGVKSGLAINPDHKTEDIEQYLENVDMLLVMSVFPGFGGQSFMESSLHNVRHAVSVREQRGLDFAIQIDGGINAETCVPARLAGADILVAGTAVFTSPDYREAIRILGGR
jgi:ribulose-phosphate 3-epimerase